MSLAHTTNAVETLKAIKTTEQDTNPLYRRPPSEKRYDSFGSAPNKQQNSNEKRLVPASSRDLVFQTEGASALSAAGYQVHIIHL